MSSFEETEVMEVGQKSGSLITAKEDGTSGNANPEIDDTQLVTQFNSNESACSTPSKNTLSGCDDTELVTETDGSKFVSENKCRSMNFKISQEDTEFLELGDMKESFIGPLGDRTFENATSEMDDTLLVTQPDSKESESSVCISPSKNVQSECDDTELVTQTDQSKLVDEDNSTVTLKDDDTQLVTQQAGNDSAGDCSDITTPKNVTAEQDDTQLVTQPDNVEVIGGEDNFEDVDVASKPKDETNSDEDKDSNRISSCQDTTHMGTQLGNMVSNGVMKEDDVIDQLGKSSFLPKPASENDLFGPTQHLSQPGNQKSEPKLTASERFGTSPKHDPEKFENDDPDATMLEDVNQSRLKFQVSDTLEAEPSQDEKTQDDDQEIEKSRLESDKKDEDSDTDFSGDELKPSQDLKEKQLSSSSSGFSRSSTVEAELPHNGLTSQKNSIQLTSGMTGDIDVCHSERMSPSQGIFSGNFSEGSNLQSSNSQGTSQGSSQSLSSTEKKLADLDDTEELIQSPDIFASQQSSGGSSNQKSLSTPSQTVSVLQLSGESTISASFDKFCPGPLFPSTPSEAKPTQETEPTEDNTTSTPLKRKLKNSDRPVEKKLKRMEEVLISSDEEMGSPNSAAMSNQKVAAEPMTDDIHDQRQPGDKWKIADSNGATNTSHGNQLKKRCIDTPSRQSIMIIDEVKASFCSHDSQDKNLDSQAFHLRYPSSQEDSDNTLSSNSLSQSLSWKSHSGCTRELSSNEQKESSVYDNTSKDKDYSSTGSNRHSIVNLEDDDVELIKSPSHHVEEINLDSSEQKLAVSTSLDGVEVLSPTPPAVTDSFLSPATNWKSPLHKHSTVSPAQLFTRGLFKAQHVKQAKHSTPESQDVESPQGNLSSIRMDSSKESSQLGTTRVKDDFELTLKIKLTCEAEIDAQGEAIMRSINSSEMLEYHLYNKGMYAKLESSPGRLADESSPGAPGSPGSVTSGPGLYTLKLPSAHHRMSMFSTTSSSSAGSSASSWRQRAHMTSSKGGEHPPAASTNAKQLDVGQEYDDSPWSKPLLMCDAFHELHHKLSENLDLWIDSHSEGKKFNPGDALNKLKSLKEETEPDEKEEGNETVMGVPNLSTAKKIPSVRERKAKATRKKTSKTKDEIPKEEKDQPANAEKETPVAAKRTRGRAGVLPTPEGSKRSTPRTRRTPSSMVEQNDSFGVTCQDGSISHLSYASHFQPGAQVFALWTERRSRNYYPAEIDHQTKAGYWQVQFHDQTRKMLAEKFILLINTFECGQPVFAKSADSEYQSGTIIGVEPLQGKEDLYTVEFVDGGGIVTVSRSDLFLSEEQAQHFLKDGPEADVSLSSPRGRTPKSKSQFPDLDKIVLGKRNRTPKSESNLTATSSTHSAASTSGTARQIITDSSSTADEGPLATELITGVQPEQEGWRTVDPLARKGTRGKKGKTAQQELPDIDDKETVQQLGPIPPGGSTIFSGKSFLVTCTDILPVHKPTASVNLDSSIISSDNEATEDESGPQHGTDSECFEFTRLPMVKTRLIRQLLAGGGKVYKTMEEVPRNELKNTLVVTNRPCLTAMYIQGLALGVHSLRHEQVIECCKENKKLVKDHSCLLPAGYSLEKKMFIMWGEHTSKHPLKGECVLVVGDKNFTHFWEDVVTLAGGQVVKFKEKKGAAVRLATVILSESTCPEAALLQAKNLNIPVVSPSWLTQCLINNNVVPYNGHASYRYDFSDVD